MPQVDLLPDEHEVPTGLGERVPVIAALMPFDWTMRQVWAAGIALWAASIQIQTTTTQLAPKPEQWIAAGLCLVGGALWIVVEYLMRPTPEFWFSAWSEYLTVLVLSFPLWWKRLLPAHAPWTWLMAKIRHIDLPEHDSRRWPLATLPRWLGQQMVGNVTVLNDGLFRVPGKFGRSVMFAAAIRIPPRPNPDLLPEIMRETIIQTRLNIFRKIVGNWSLILDVVPFEEHALIVAAGPAWEWVRDYRAGYMVSRQPVLVLKNASSSALAKQVDAVLDRFERAGIPAEVLTPSQGRRNLATTWGENGVAGLSAERVRIGIRRVIAGRRAYRSFVVKLLPRVIHLAWLRPLTCESLLCRIAIHVSTRPAGATRRGLQRMARRWRAVDTDDDYELAADDAKRVLNAMRRQLDTQAKVAMYVTAPEDQAEKVAEALDSCQCEYSPADFMQHRALRATRILGHDPLDRPMSMDLRSVACTDLMATAGHTPKGFVLIGTSLESVEPVGVNLIDKKQILNSASFIAITQGGGKTTLAQLIAWRSANPHPEHELTQSRLQIVTVDFKRSGDYEPLFKRLADRGHQASYNSWSEGPIPPIDGHMGFNLSNIPNDQRGTKLLELGQRVQEWSDEHALDGVLMLIVDEVLAMARLREGAEFIYETGTQGRSMSLVPIYCTQHVGPVLKHEPTQMAFVNAGHLFLGRQNPAGLHAAAPLLQLDNPTQVLLAGAPAGTVLLRVERRDGPVLVGVQIEPSPWELQEFGTNPEERAFRRDRSVSLAVSGNTRSNGREVTSPWNGSSSSSSG